MDPVVFVSYASEDMIIADEVRAALEAARIPCWIAPRDICPGADFTDRIVEALQQCRLLVLVLSRYSNASTHVGAELRLAMDNELPRVPIRIEDVAPAGGKIYTLSGCQWLDAIPAPTPAQLQALIEAVSARLAGADPPPVSAAPLAAAGTVVPISGPALQTNLPADVSSLVGREREGAELRAVLESEGARLVTLTGPGGVGKTRLALRVAREWAAAHGLPACFVEMEGLQSGAAAAPAILAALAVPQSPNQDPARQLGEVLGRQPLLLICDNTEQIADLGVFLQRLQAEAPGLHCLVTSRAVLGLPGEKVYRLGPLPLPASGATLDEIEHCESVALFADRARSVAPDWRLDATTAEDVAEICRRLDGMPLCLELAASRMAMLSAHEALEGLEDVLGFLASRSPNLPPRQRTLRGAIEWSRRLLPEEDQAAWAQLSVLRGGFFREAAAAVTGSPYLLDLLQDLQGHSLITAQAAAGRTRYTMLETVRAYAAETLAPPQVADPQAARRRHAEHFARVAETLTGAIRTPGEAAALAEAGLEHDNLRAALTWAEAEDAALCARLAPLAADLLTRRGSWADALRSAERGLAAARRASDGDLLAGALLAWGSARHDHGALDEARAAAEEALALWRENGDALRVARALNLLALIAHDAWLARRARERERSGAAAPAPEPIEARELFTEALALCREAASPAGEAIALSNLGRLALHEGHAREAREHLEQALALRERLGDRRGYAETLTNLGVLAQEAGDLRTAWSHYRDSLCALRELGDEAGCAYQLYNLGEVAGLAGDYERAIPLAAGAARIFRHLDAPAARDTEMLLLHFSDQPGAQPFADRLRAADALRAAEIMELADAGTVA